MGLLGCCGGRERAAIEARGSMDSADGSLREFGEFENPAVREQRTSYRDRISATLTRLSSRSSAPSTEKVEQLLDDDNVLCMTRSHMTNHPDLKWRGRGVRERARIMRAE